MKSNEVMMGGGGKIAGTSLPQIRTLTHW